MNLIEHFKAAKVPPRRYSGKFKGPKNDKCRPRFRRPRRKMRPRFKP